MGDKSLTEVEKYFEAQRAHDRAVHDQIVKQRQSLYTKRNPTTYGAEIKFECYDCHPMGANWSMTYYDRCYNRVWQDFEILIPLTNAIIHDRKHPCPHYLPFMESFFTVIGVDMGSALERDRSVMVIYDEAQDVPTDIYDALSNVSKMLGHNRICGSSGVPAEVIDP